LGTTLETKLCGLNGESSGRAQTYLTEYKAAWESSNRIRTVLNRATIGTADEAAASRSDATNLVAALKATFGWLNVSPKLHILLEHAPDFLDEFDSIGLYSEQGLEAWNGRYSQSTRLYPGETELASAAAFMRAMALAGDASCAILERLAPRRAPLKMAAHKAVSPGDKRLRANKPPLPLCDETMEKLERERTLWATKVFSVAAVRRVWAARARLERTVLMKTFGV